MSKPKEVHVECYEVVIEAVTRKDDRPITTAIGGLRNDSGHGRALGPFNLYQEDELNTHHVNAQTDVDGSYIWHVSVDNVEQGEFPVFHAEATIDLRKTRAIRFVIEDAAA